jgi:CO/xanthine dehydrogenase Mo-binding subunit
VNTATRLISQGCDLIQKKRFREALPITVRKSIKSQKGKWDPEGFEGVPYSQMTYGAASVELTLDPGSLIPIISGICLAIDCGQVLHPEIARSVLESEIEQSLALCFTQTAEGFTVTREIPMISRTDIRIHFMKRNTIPSGIEGIAASTIPAAFMQAVNQILHKPVFSLPLTHDLIVETFLDDD